MLFFILKKVDIIFVSLLKFALISFELYVKSLRYAVHAKMQTKNVNLDKTISFLYRGMEHLDEWCIKKIEKTTKFMCIIWGLRYMMMVSHCGL